MEEGKINFIPRGTVTTPNGFLAGATYARIKTEAELSLDLGLLFSEAPCVTAGQLTSNKIKSAPVLLCKERLRQGRAVAVVVNSGCANACTGEQGLADANEMVALAAAAIGESPEEILVASTGIIGEPLPMEKIKTAMSQIIMSHDGGHELARAMMTTDTVPKETALSAKDGDIEFTIGGVAKGAGMIHPNLATMLCFLTTDAAVELDFLKSALHRAIDISLNMITVDGDTSPSDTVLIMANGLAENEPISSESPLADIFQQALDQVCIYLAKEIAGDGEGATRRIEVTVNGAVNATEARLAARTVVGSCLLKSAVHGADPNLGRVLTAVGQSGVELIESNIDLYIGDIRIVKSGMILPFDKSSAAKILNQSEVPISVHLNMGEASATAWGCDLSEEYVTLNSQYRT